MKNFALYVAIICLIFSIDAIDSAPVGIEGRNYVFLESPFQMNDVAGQDDEAGILQMD
jgi:hypothetical protein